MKHRDQQESTKAVDKKQNKLYQEYLKERTEQIQSAISFVLGLRESDRQDSKEFHRKPL